jgi:phenylacetate-CoA ligase
MILYCEVKGGADGLEAAIETSLRAVTGLGGGAVLADPGSLANDGKVIEDRRDLG